MRPPIPTRACPPPMHELIEQCWDEDPALRPNFVRIRAIIKKVIGKSGDNIVDHLFNRMDVHTAALEHQVQYENQQIQCKQLLIMESHVSCTLRTFVPFKVHELVTHFNEERQRSAEILKTILPT